MLNRVSLIGNLTQDPELKQTPGGNSVVSFTVAVNFPKKDNEKGVDYVPCVVWGKQAENLAKYQSKGGKLYVEGSFKTRTYEKNGEKRYVSEVLVQTIQYLSPKVDGQPQYPQPMDEEISIADVPF